MNIDTTWMNIDDAIDNEDLLNGGGQLRTSFGNLLRTGQDPLPGRTSGHGSMGDDRHMVPHRENNTDPAPGAGRYYLLPLYLQAICELDQ